MTEKGAITAHEPPTLPIAVEAASSELSNLDPTPASTSAVAAHAHMPDLDSIDIKKLALGSGLGSGGADMAQSS